MKLAENISANKTTDALFALVEKYATAVSNTAVWDGATEHSRMCFVWNDERACIVGICDIPACVRRFCAMVDKCVDRRANERHVRVELSDVEKGVGFRVKVTFPSSEWVMSLKEFAVDDWRA